MKLIGFAGGISVGIEEEDHISDHCSLGEDQVREGDPDLHPGHTASKEQPGLRRGTGTFGSPSNVNSLFLGLVLQSQPHTRALPIGLMPQRASSSPSLGFQGDPVTQMLVCSCQESFEIAGQLSAERPTTPSHLRIAKPLTIKTI